MNTRAIILFVLFIKFTGLSSLIASDEQDTIFVRKSADFFERIEVMNPWHLSDNPAGFVFYPVNNISRVLLGYSYQDENLRWAQAPGNTVRYEAQTEGIRRIGRFVMKGGFRYQNDQYRDILFNNTMVFDNRNIYTTGDTLGGRQRNEGYFMNAGAGFVLRENWIVGLDLDYKTTVGAKMQDPRNQNTQSRLDIVPGILYRRDNLNFGLSGGPIWERNYVSIRNMLDERHSLFHMMGMGYYGISRNVTSESYLFENLGFHAGFQFSIDRPGFTAFQHVQYTGTEMERLEGSSYRLLAGITQKDEITYAGKALFESDIYLHQIDLTARFTRLVGSEITQETYSVGEGDLRWFEIRTIRWIDDKHIVNDLDVELGYQLSGLGTRRQPLIYEVEAGAGFSSYQANHYPVHLYGTYEVQSVSAYVGYQHYFRFPQFDFTPSVRLTARQSVADTYMVQDQDRFNSEIPRRDFQYLVTDYYKADVGMRLSRPLRMGRLQEAYLGIFGSYLYMPDIEEENHNRLMRFSLGLVF